MSSEPNKERQRRVQIHPRLSADLGKRLRTFASAKGSSQNSVVQSALKKYLDDGYDGTLILRRLDRLSRAVINTHRDVTVVADALATFVQVFFAQTPPLSESAKAAAERSALMRYEQFSEHVAARLSSGRSMLADFLPDAGGEGAETADDSTSAKKGDGP